MLRTVRFEVMGKPATKGSFKPMGKFVQHDNPRLKGWAGFVAFTAHQAWNGPPVDGPMAVELVIWKRRPKSHYRANGQLKSDAPRYPGNVFPDGEKVERALYDAMTGIVYMDDRQICTAQWCKRYGEHDCIAVTISELPDHA